MLVLSVAFFVINKLYLLAMHATLSEYQGINEAGKLPITTYVRRGLYAFKQLFLPSDNSSAFMYPFGMIWLYRGMLLLVGIGMICRWLM